MNETINITKHGDGLLVKPTGFMNRDRFNDYLAACRKVDGKYNASEKAQVCSLEKIVDLLQQLAARAFTPAVSDDVTHLIEAGYEAKQAELDDAKQLHGEALDRMDKINADLAKRGMALFGYQQDGVPWLSHRKAGLLADDMGLGKTVQALIAMPDADRCSGIVVCPASLKGNWKKEISMWRPEFEVTVLSGRNNFRWPVTGEIVIINYDVLPRFTDADSKLPGRHNPIRPTLECKMVREGDEDSGFDVVEPAPANVVLIADEAHGLKNHRTQRHQRFKVLQLHVVANDGACWGLTGTPLLNRPPELWGVLQAFGLEREAFGTWNNMVSLFGGHRGRYGMVWPDLTDTADSIDPRVPEMLKPVMLKRRRHEVLPDLPTKTYKDLAVNGLDAKTRALCDDLVNELMAAGFDIDSAESIERAVGVNQVLFTLLSRVRAALAKAKIPAMLEVVEQYEEAEEPLVVFSAHRAPIDLLGERDGWATITGSTDPDTRTAIVDRFQAGLLKGLALTIEAGGVGLTLTNSCHALFVDLAWTPAKNGQAEDRICRIGQTRGCVITRLTAEHVVDERVNELLIQKQVLIEKAVDAASQLTVKAPEFKDKVERVEIKKIGLDPAAAALKAIADRQLPSNAPRQQPTHAGRRGPESPQEVWAANALIQLAADDQDRAREVNFVGFNRFDNSFGHSLAQQVLDACGLSDSQWKSALVMLTKYQGQVGPKPEEG